MQIQYSAGRTITAAEFVDVLVRSTLGERRPIHDLQLMQTMLDRASLTCTAWHGQKLVGVARSLTDFVYCCYLSDLAVDMAYQRLGVGKQLLRETKARLATDCNIILLAAPKAREYYPRIGFARHDSAWVMKASGPVP